MPNHFLSIKDFSSEEIENLLELALRLKRERLQGGNRPILRGKVLGMIFQKPSLRTRVSFDMAMRQVGGDALYLSPSEIGLGQRESVADVSRVLSSYVDAIMARVFAYEHILELARYSRVPVINGLSDYDHPCQAMADLLTLKEHFSDLKGLTLAYIGDGNNVAVSLVQACSKLGMNFSIASPKGYSLSEEVVTECQKDADAHGSRIRLLHDPAQAVPKPRMFSIPMPG